MGTVAITTLTTNQTNVNATQFNNLVVPLLNEFNGSIDNTNVAAAAGIAYSKLSLAGSVVNADISSSAAIAFDKLATLTGGNILVGNASNEATSVAMSGDATLSNTGALTIANDAVETAMINDDAVTAAKLAGIVGVPSTYHVEATAKDTTTSTSYTDLNSMSITFTPSSASNPILIMFSCTCDNNNAGSRCDVILDISGAPGNIASTERRSTAPASGLDTTAAFQYYTTLAAASTTVKVQFKASANTAGVEARALTIIEFKQN